MAIVDPEQTLQTARLVLESLSPAHAAVLYEVLRAPALYTFIPQEPPTAPDSLHTRYVALAARRSPDGRDVWLNWALRRRDSAVYVGTIQATVQSDGTALLASMTFVEGQGYATEGARCVVAHLFDDYHVQVVAAEIDTRNVPSMRLVEALGFTRVATLRGADVFKGAVSDEYRYERRGAAPN